MDQTSNYPHLEEAELDNKILSQVNNAVTEVSFCTLSEEGNLHLPSSVCSPLANSLEDRLAFDLKLFQFILSEAEAAFKAPVRHFFNPGGQQLQFIYTLNPSQFPPERNGHHS